jgi:hypothetical protein
MARQRRRHGTDAGRFAQKTCFLTDHHLQFCHFLLTGSTFA